MSQGRVWVRLGVAAMLATKLAGCGAAEPITQTPFERAATDAASIFAAAAYTLRWVHSEPALLTVEYGQASMINYAEQVASAPDELPTLVGAPAPDEVAQLVAVVAPAVADIQDACLMPGCDWESQAEALEAARDALLTAIE